jgi:hypothetical protein
LYGMNEYLIIAHEMEKARLLARRARRARKRRSSPTGSPPEDLKSTSSEDDGVRALPGLEEITETLGLDQRRCGGNDEIPPQHTKLPFEPARSQTLDKTAL